MFDIRKICAESQNEKDDFVGLRFENGQPKVIFPRGFQLSEDEEQVRRDVIRLFAVIKRFSGKEQGNLSGSLDGELDVDFPILSYQFLIQDFLANGYYIERETRYTSGQRGKINWKQTIQKKKPVVSNGNIVYLDFIVKTNRINENNLLTRIHEYCVRESFEKLGWLYLAADALPPKPDLPYDSRMFTAVLQEALNNTFHERKRMLFTCMLNIINGKEKMRSASDSAFGVKKFEVVWEGLLDFVFGEDNKSDYYPHAAWYIIKDKQSHTSSAMRPDTIMRYQDRIYILDAKYYKYGITLQPEDLPNTADVAKQIVYGECVQNKTGCGDDQIYNAFLMPFARQQASDPPYQFVSVATAQWKQYDPSTPNYHYVLGILVDTRFLIEQHCRHNESQILELSRLIEESLAAHQGSASED